MSSVSDDWNEVGSFQVKAKAAWIGMEMKPGCPWAGPGHQSCCEGGPRPELPFSRGHLSDLSARGPDALRGIARLSPEPHRAASLYGF